LAEKEVLLKEVHHRVKNNLMTIIGLIKIEEVKADNEMVNALLLELDGRVRSMALVHENLCKSKDFTHIDLQQYIEMMSAHIRAQFGGECDIRFSVQTAGEDMVLDIAVPCGLILNELITNAFKHAFPGGKPRDGEDICEIAITVKQDGGDYMLTVADNGVGMAPEIDWKNPETTGLRLVRMLSRQINGTIEMEQAHGTIFQLRFAYLSR
jgi:two-component sensor histidine kinase